PALHTEAIALFDHLSTLKVFIELNDNASDFSKEYKTGRTPLDHLYFPRFKVNTASKATQRFFKAFFTNNPYAHLTSLEVCFLRLRECSHRRRESHETSITIKRLERDDAPSPLEGGYTVVAPGKWEECDVSTRRII
ncbi:MAG: hypothetical protein Q9224_002883, partial [Gallowayella concinna]